MHTTHKNTHNTYTHTTHTTQIYSDIHAYNTHNTQTHKALYKCTETALVRHRFFLLWLGLKPRVAPSLGAVLGSSVCYDQLGSAVMSSQEASSPELCSWVRPSQSHFAPKQLLPPVKSKPFTSWLLRSLHLGSICFLADKLGTWRFLETFSM